MKFKLFKHNIRIFYDLSVIYANIYNIDSRIYIDGCNNNLEKKSNFLYNIFSHCYSFNSTNDLNRSIPVYKFS